MTFFLAPHSIFIIASCILFFIVHYFYFVFSPTANFCNAILSPFLSSDNFLLQILIYNQLCHISHIYFFQSMIVCEEKLIACICNFRRFLLTGYVNLSITVSTKFSSFFSLCPQTSGCLDHLSISRIMHQRNTLNFINLFSHEKGSICVIDLDDNALLLLLKNQARFFHIL